MMRLCVFALAVSTVSASSGSGGDLWKETWAWVNLFLLFFLIWRYVLPFVGKHLDQGIAEIELKLGQEEADRKALDGTIHRLQTSLSGVDAEGQSIIEQAKSEISAIKNSVKEIQDFQIKIIEDRVETDARAYALDKMDELKARLFAQVVSDSETTLNAKKPEMRAYENRSASQVG